MFVGVKDTDRKYVYHAPCTGAKALSPRGYCKAEE
jgi:hypothetical protein